MLYILYLDASGDDGRYVGTNTKNYALMGIAATPEISFTLSYCIRTLIDLHFENIPPEEKPKELHYVALRNPKHPYDKINTLALVDDVFKLLVKSDVTLFSMSVDKERHYKKYKEPWPPRELLLEHMINRFQKYLGRIGDIGMIVYDSESFRINKNMIELFET